MKRKHKLKFVLLLGLSPLLLGQNETIYMALRGNTSATLLRQRLGNQFEPVFTHDQGIFHLQIDTIRNRLYWVEYHFPRYLVKTSNLSGNDIATIMVFEEPDLAFVVIYLDPVGGDLYWGTTIGRPFGESTGQIGRADRDGGNKQVILEETGRGIAVDPFHRVLYYSDLDQDEFKFHTLIYRYELDTGVNELLFNLDSYLGSDQLILDPVGERLYFAVIGVDSRGLASIDLNGGNFYEFGYPDSPAAVDFFNQKVYIAQSAGFLYPTTILQRLNNDGTGYEVIYTDPNGNQVTSVAVFNSNSFVTIPTLSPRALTVLVSVLALAGAMMPRLKRKNGYPGGSGF